MEELGTVHTAVIILGHGSRRQGSGDPLADIAVAVRKALGWAIVEHAFLQYVPPTLPEATARCVGQGAEKIIIVPFFVQLGAHVSVDIPETVARLQDRYPQITISCTDYVGAHPLMVRIVQDLVEKTMGK